VPEVLPEGYAAVVAPQSAAELSAAMLTMPQGDWGEHLRRRYEECYTTDRHVAALSGALEFA
jgi:hypothetical protein